MQCACAILSPVACPALQNFSTLSHKRHDIRKKLFNIKCMTLFSLHLLSEIFPILGRNERFRIRNCIVLHVKCPLFFSDFDETWISSTDFRRRLKYQILWKSVQWEPNCSMWKDRWTKRRIDMKKLIVTFRNFGNVPENPPPPKIKITNLLFFLMDCSSCLQL